MTDDTKGTKVTKDTKDRGGTGRIVLAIALCALASGAAAQERRTSTGATIEFIAGQPALGPIVRAAPYSGEATTTVTQVLADGTRIERTTVTRLFRDGEGRVRREQTVQGLGPLNPEGQTTIVTIVDPVANVSYALDPLTRIARRAVVGPLAMKIDALSGIDTKVAPPPPPPPGGGPVFDPLAPPPPPPPPPPGAVARGRGPGTPAGAVPNMPQPLGTRQIEGVDAVGTKRVEVIPAGRIGNDRPIEITDERWESTALKVLLQSRHSDPRTGVVEYRLTNIVRAEPSADLFVVPPDYTIVNAKNDERR